MTQPRFFVPGGLALAALALAGCGGGGGNDPTRSQSAGVQGKVVDTTGAVVTGATVRLDDGQQATSLSQGGYRLDHVNPGVHTVTASINQNGQSFTGSTQVAVSDGSLQTNTNLVVSPPGDQGTISGTVRDAGNHAISGARVLLQIPITTSGSDFSGVTAFTRSDGTYQFSNVPIHNAQNSVLAFTLAASQQGYLNQTQSSVTVPASGVDFQLTPGGGSVSTPSNVTAYAFTQPGSASQPFTAGRSARGVYERIRRVLSPEYAHLMDLHRAQTVKRLSQKASPHDFGATAVEIDLAFTPAPQSGLLGYTVYRTAGTASFPQQGRDQYDFLQDPLANYYTDLDPSYSPGTQYNFALSSTNTNNQEMSGLSGVASVTPLDRISLDFPQSGQSYARPVSFSWGSIFRASSYVVFVYDVFPGAETSPVLTSPNLGSPGYSTSSLNSGQDYWAVAAGVTSDGRAVTVSQIVRFHVQ